MRTPNSHPFHRALLACVLGAACLIASAQPSAPAAPGTRAPQAKTVLPARNMTVELRVVDETPPASGAQQWGAGAPAPAEEWQRVGVANGEKARFEFSSAQAWAWTHTAVRGNGAGSADAVGQSLQWAQDVRALECEVAWPGGSKPARLAVSVQTQTSGLGSVEGVRPQPARAQVQTVVLVPLGVWFTLARNGPRPALLTEGSYSSRSAAEANAQLLQVRVLAPD